MKTGNIFRIQKYSIHDGPGIRTAVFLKGCPLECQWCHNPEGRLPVPEIVYHKERCMLCGRCLRACECGAIDIGNGGFTRYKSKCSAESVGAFGSQNICSACTKVCPGNALEPVGRIMTVSEAMEAIRSDLIFYDESGGGVTFTGGEPFMQFEFLRELMINCCREDIHTAVETSGHTAWENLRDAGKYTGLFLYDLKLMDNEKHIQFTGVPNKQILDNLRKLASEHGGIRVRIPFIPGINDDNENIEHTCLFLNSIHINKVDLLPYHNTGIYKYKQLGLDYKLTDTSCPDKKGLETVAGIFGNYGISAKIGG